MSMIRSLLRLWLKHPARWLLPFLVAPGIVLILSRPPMWRGNWTWTLDWMGGALILAGPIAAGLGAWRAYSTRRSFAPYLDASHVGGRLGLVEIGGTALWACLGHLIAVIIASTMTITGGASGLPPFWIVGPQLLLLGAWTSFGWMIGSALPSVATAPTLAIAAYGLVVAGLQGNLPTDWFSIGGATSPMIGMRPAVTLLVLQSAMWIAITFAGIPVRRRTSGHMLDLPLVFWGLATVALVAAVFIAKGGWPRSEAVAQGTACQGDAPRVCVLDDTRMLLPEAAQILSKLTQTAQDAGADTPRVYVPVDEAPLDDRTRRPFEIAPNTSSPRDLVNFVVHDMRCLRGDDAPPGDKFIVVDGVGGVLLVRAGYETRESLRDPLVDRILALPPEEQNTVITAAISSAVSCHYESVPLIQ